MADEESKLDRLVARLEAVAATQQQAAQTIATVASSRDSNGVSWAQLLVGCAITGLLTGGGAFFVNWGQMRVGQATITERVDGHTRQLEAHEKKLEKHDGQIAELTTKARSR